MAISAMAVAIVAVEVLVVSYVTGWTTPWIAVVIIGAVLGAMAVLALGSWRIIVRVLDGASGRSLEILYGPGPLVRQMFRPEQILGANAQRLSFGQMGGWGYRGSLRLFKYAALSTRSGDALMLSLVGGRRFVVTVDEPEAFAAALNSRRAP
jgi:hypothetical protein